MYLSKITVCVIATPIFLSYSCERTFQMKINFYFSTFKKYPIRKHIIDNIDKQFGFIYGPKITDFIYNCFSNSFGKLDTALFNEVLWKY